jgi:hypothetical protein
MDRGFRRYMFKVGLVPRAREGVLHKKDAAEAEGRSASLASLPATWVQFGLGAVLQCSNTPSLRAAGFEDEDENEAPGEWCPKLGNRAGMLARGTKSLGQSSWRSAGSK